MLSCIALVIQNFTDKSDVYSFGVLLERLTGKAAIQSSRREYVVDLPSADSSSRNDKCDKIADMRPTTKEVTRMIEEIRPSKSEDSLALIGG
ncbi:hypothetical protein V6N12_061106 [Hibiscus sabdariffa]|uniref:Serine-threonine/tyrosine-protein kinase catalytic domain-containing protein n=1 Tax=Hibiscus sabdariffa TaxID=183260 RepID=A0ABR2DW30_9ROSI